MRKRSGCRAQETPSASPSVLLLLFNPTNKLVHTGILLHHILRVLGKITELINNLCPIQYMLLMVIACCELVGIGFTFGLVIQVRVETTTNTKTAFAF